MPDRFASSAIDRRPRLLGPGLPAFITPTARVRASTLVAAAAWAQAALILAAFGLRLILVARYPLREDEAIYGYWALHFWHEDPFFLTVWPDKPPLYIWLLSSILHYAGPTDAAARWLDIAASTLTVAVIGATARTVWGRTAGLAAALVAALSPFAVSFGATAYTDPLLVLWGSLAFYAAVRRRAIWAGAALGAAVMTKQQGLLYAPLVLAALLWASGHLGEGYAYPDRRRRFLSLGRALLGASLIVLPIVAWDSLRWHTAPSPWALGVQHYGDLRLLPPEKWAARMGEWAVLVWHLTGSWFVWGGILVSAAMTVGLARSRGRDRLARPFSDRLVLLLCGWAGGFLFLHVITSVQFWDRYLLPLTLVPALLAGWVAARWVTVLPLRVQVLVGFCALILLLPPGLRAADGKLSLGGDHGDYAGLREAFATLAMAGSGDIVLYHRTLGWQARFYLYDAIRSGQVELRWFPNAVYLADNAVKTPHKQKFLITPVWAPERNLSQQLATRRLALEQVMRSGNFAVYTLESREPAYCDWCRCDDASAGLSQLEMADIVAAMTPR